MNIPSFCKDCGSKDLCYDCMALHFDSMPCNIGVVDKQVAPVPGLGLMERFRQINQGQEANSFYVRQ